MPLKENANKNLIQDLFEFSLTTQFHNIEDEEDKSDIRTEFNNKLGCIIDNQQEPVDNLEDGIRAGLVSKVEKHSEKHGKNCLWKKQQKISSLPKYLTVQKIRFIWREKDEGTNTEARKAKILRNVAFPRVLDLYEFCTKELQE